jgi:hypothetical protein
MSSITFLGDVWLGKVFQYQTQFAGEFIFNLEAPITQSHKQAFGKICLKAKLPRWRHFRVIGNAMRLFLCDQSFRGCCH